MREKVCRLCLQTISGNYQEIGETANFFLKLNLDISNETVTCVECTNNLQIFLNLKSACDPVNTKNTNNLIGGPKDQIRCNFCTNLTEKGNLISLYRSTENIFLVDTLEKYIPELNLNNTELFTCETCLDGMQNVSRFLTNCLYVEEKIAKYIELEGANNKGHVELQDVGQFVFIQTLKVEPLNELEHTYDQVQEDTGKAGAEIIYEKEVDNLELNAKIENVDIKSEGRDYDSFQEPTGMDNDPLETSPHKYEMCSYNTKYKGSIKHHVLTHSSSEDTTHKNRQNPLETMLYKCESCPYQTNRKEYLNRHKLPKVKCEMCDFKTNRRYALKAHMLLHTNPSEVTLYKCDTCTYETKRKDHLNEHKLSHKNPSEIKMFSCEMCPFETKLKRYLSRHVLIVHKIPSDTTLYKCGSCAYETVHKHYLSQHKFTHRSVSEITMLKCEMCTFETKRKSSLKSHMLTHKNPAEITMFKCELCSFETKHKRSLEYHILTHKGPSEVTMFKCELCTYETKRKRGINRHLLLIHKTSNKTL